MCFSVEHNLSAVECLQVNNINVMVRTTTKNSIEEYGDQAKFLEDNQYLLGKQVFLGELLWQPSAMPSPRPGQHQMAYNDAHDIN